MNLTEYLIKENITQASLGEMLGVSQGAVGQWKLDGRKIPAEYCPTIERISNRQVTCEELRPDIDWAYLREEAQPTDVQGRRSTDQKNVSLQSHSDGQIPTSIENKTDLTTI